MRHCHESTPKFGSVIAPSFSDLPRSTISSTSTVDTRPIPSHVGHMPCGSLKLNTFEGPAYGSPRRLKTSRSIVYASVAVPTVERAFAPIRSWSTVIAAVRLRSVSTSGRPTFGMNDWMKAV
jgi:hypothetical protein